MAIFGEKNKTLKKCTKQLKLRRLRMKIRAGIFVTKRKIASKFCGQKSLQWQIWTKKEGATKYYVPRSVRFVALGLELFKH